MLRLLLKLEDARSERRHFTTNDRITKRVSSLLKSSKRKRHNHSQNREINVSKLELPEQLCPFPCQPALHKHLRRPEGNVRLQSALSSHVNPSQVPSAKRKNDHLSED